MKISQIKLSKVFRELFPLDDYLVIVIKESIQKDGYDSSQPVVLWKEKRILVDGHIRLEAAKRANLKDVPVVLRDFKDEDAAIEAAILYQRNRRNLTDAELFRVSEFLDKRRKRGGDHKSQEAKSISRNQEIDTSETTGQILGIGKNKISQIRAIRDYGSDDTKQEVMQDKKSINKAYEEVREERQIKKEESKKTFNRTNEKVDWANWTWNPVVGCKRGCPYCYAAVIAKRFYGNFKPTFYPERLSAPANTNIPKGGGVGSKSVFVSSMGDLFGDWVSQKWIETVMEVVRKNLQWNFIFLTKSPERLVGLDWTKNCWVGATVDCQARVEPTVKAFIKLKNQRKMGVPPVRFISCEPMTEAINFHNGLSQGAFNWLIIGGWGELTPIKVEPPKWEWIENLLRQARDSGCLVYFKPNLMVRPKEYPEEDVSRGRK